jgi:hypothetical protein
LRLDAAFALHHVEATVNLPNRILQLLLGLALVWLVACSAGDTIGPVKTVSPLAGVTSPQQASVAGPGIMATAPRPCRGMCPPPPPIDTIYFASRIVGTMKLDPKYLYILTKSVVVGDELGKPGELVIPPGTRIEGRVGTALIVSRNGRIRATGTLDAPVWFTCVDNGDGRFPGCWLGVMIAGNAKLTVGNPALGPAPLIPGRNPFGGGLQDQRAGVRFGGKNDADSSGELRYTGIEYGGNAGLGLGGLTLGACGAGTAFESVMVQGSAGSDVQVIGGSCGGVGF